MSKTPSNAHSQEAKNASTNPRDTSVSAAKASCTPSNRPLFQPGKIVATPGALDLLMRAGMSYQGLLDKHLCGDWIDMDRDDWAANNDAIKSGARIFSSFDVKGVKLWIITEAVSDIAEDGQIKAHPSRSSTCFLLPEEY